MPREELRVQPEALELGRAVLRAEAAALGLAADRLAESFPRAVALLLGRRGKVVASGVGKSGLVARRIAATLTSTGTPTVYLHPVDALHGDVGLVESGDVALVVSKSGAGAELEPLLPLFARLGCPLIALTAEADSPLARAAEIVIAFGPLTEAGPLPEVPTTSTLVSQALGDALAGALAAARGFEPRDFHVLHPGGVLGRRALLTVRDAMHAGDAMPVVGPDESLRAALLVIMEKRLGLTVVAGDDGALLGVLTDGDLKRILLARGTDGFFETRVADVMNPSPRTIAPEALVAAAVRHMEDDPPGPITALLVIDEAHRALGVLHLHDCLKLGVR
ncbi:MAG: KpsF/GutQ family sugar-phosphate isomerase [Candidatus Eisenbacteria bacterium]